jgi:siroheme synthase (precorrin-2 oxidase/ferrochelatase)
MKGYPLFLNLEGEPCIVFGGGKVAHRKVQALPKRGAKVTCISKEFCGSLKRLVGAPLRGRPQSKGRAHSVAVPRSDASLRRHRPAPTLRLKRIGSASIVLNGARLVIAATSDRAFNEKIAKLSRRKRIWVNVVDDPELCDFTVPAVVERGPLQIAISTDGTSPLFARRLREELEKVIHPSTGRLLEKIGKIRRKWIKNKNLK